MHPRAHKLFNSPVLRQRQRKRAVVGGEGGGKRVGNGDEGEGIKKKADVRENVGEAGG